MVHACDCLHIDYLTHTYIFTYIHTYIRLQGRTHYRGQMFGDKRHGLGVLKYVDGSVYEGEWQGNEASMLKTCVCTCVCMHVCVCTQIHAYISTHTYLEFVFKGLLHGGRFTRSVCAQTNCACVCENMYIACQDDGWQILGHSQQVSMVSCYQTHSAHCRTASRGCVCIGVTTRMHISVLYLCAGAFTSARTYTHTHINSHTFKQASGFGCERIAEKEEYKGQFTRGKRGRRGVVTRQDGLTISGQPRVTDTQRFLVSVCVYTCVKMSVRRFFWVQVVGGGTAIPTMIDVRYTRHNGFELGSAHVNNHLLVKGSVSVQKEPRTRRRG
jgi:hypothetical protein